MYVFCFQFSALEGYKTISKYYNTSMLNDELICMVVVSAFQIIPLKDSWKVCDEHFWERHPHKTSKSLRQSELKSFYTLHQIRITLHTEHQIIPMKVSIDCYEKDTLKCKLICSCEEKVDVQPNLKAYTRYSQDKAHAEYKPFKWLWLKYMGQTSLNATNCSQKVYLQPSKCLHVLQPIKM